MAALGEDLLNVVNKLQDLVFNTIGNDSLDLPQIVRPSRNRQAESSLTLDRSSLDRNHQESHQYSRMSLAEISSHEVAESSPEDR